MFYCIRTPKGNNLLKFLRLFFWQDLIFKKLLNRTLRVFLRLEQILGLKYMGFSLQQIQKILNQSTVSWKQSLEQQLRMIQQQQKHLRELERIIQGVLYSVQFENDVKWTVIFDIIHMFQKYTSTVHRLFESYFYPDERDIIKHLNEQTNENDFYKWQ